MYNGMLSEASPEYLEPKYTPSRSGRTPWWHITGRQQIETEIETETKMETATETEK